MHLRQRVASAAQAARLGLSVRRFLATPIDRATAHAVIRRRLARREERFLDAVKHLVFDHPGSPYHKLLRWAGYDERALAKAVRTQGLDQALAQLRDAGVYVSLEEFRGRRPIVRKGLEIETSATAFAHPMPVRAGLTSQTSGTSGAPHPVRLDWADFEEQAASNYVLYETHGLLEYPLALWLATQGVGGLHALLQNAKRGHPPERWFAPVPSGLRGTSPLSKLAPHWLRVMGWSVGVSLPRPEPVSVQEASLIASWFTDSRGEPQVLRTSASGGVRVAEAVRRRGGLAGEAVMLVAGEPLTPERRRAIEAAGFTAIPHYGAAEAGLIAGSCGSPIHCDDMHLFVDRLAVVPQAKPSVGPVANHEPPNVRLLFTTLSKHAGQVLLNADIGDEGRLEQRRCGCLLGELGMTLHASHVRSPSKLTGEGVALLTEELNEAVAACIERFRGGPNDYQFMEYAEGGGPTQLALAVKPELEMDEAAFLKAVYTELRAKNPVIAEMWTRAETLRIVRVHPQPNDALKLPPLARMNR